MSKLKRCAFALVALLFGMSLAAGAAVACRCSKDRTLRAVHERALKDPGDEASFRALLASLPKSGSNYIFEGDLVMSDQELREYLLGRNTRRNLDVAALGDDAMSRAKLQVDVDVDARTNLWPWGSRSFRYAIDVKSFNGREYTTSVLKPLKDAASSWQDVCPECKIRYEYVDATGSPVPSDEITFVVRFDPTATGYFASAFFPNAPTAKRYLTISPLWYGMKYASEGVLRHELGHTLGYRHEYVGHVNACVVEAGRARRLTEYDAKSVMQFFCGGPGTPGMNLTDRDAAGHKLLYSWHWE